MQFEKNIIKLSKDNRRNILEYDDIFYIIDYLNPKHRFSKGGNSAVFKLVDSNDGMEYVIKFSKFPNIPTNKQRNVRFQHEIDALYKAKDENFGNVIEILFDSVHRIDGQNFSYYVMEKAESDLTSYLNANNLALNQKYFLCYQIIKGIREIHSMNLYHRDIKPDNIFFVGDTWKIGDLGLSQYRNQNPILDKVNEKIGPYGWLSPEVMNKVLCEGTPLSKIHDCVIDTFSDIFQLGKMIWFIFNGNVPIGQIKSSDFKNYRKEVFDAVFNMLQYNKRDRGRLDSYEEVFELLSN